MNTRHSAARALVAASIALVSLLAVAASAATQVAGHGAANAPAAVQFDTRDLADSQRFLFN